MLFLDKSCGWKTSMQQIPEKSKIKNALWNQL